jgi:chromate transporter
MDKAAELDAKTSSAAAAPQPVPVLDLVRYLLRLGTLGFGGPVALCGLMERVLVDE